MPYTNINQLLANDITGGIMNGDGSASEYGALYYFEDILKVLQQGEEEPNFNPNQLEQISVVFPKVDEELHEISVLALKKGNAGEDNSLVDNSKYYPLVALPWPSYYQRNLNGGTENFPGKPNYLPGNELTNGM